MCDALIVDYLNIKQPCNIILLDFIRAFDKVLHRSLLSKLCKPGIAFDKVPHCISLSKLCKLGFDGDALAWITNFLHGRQQVVRYQGGSYAPFDVTARVVQGSSTGALIFSAFIYDLSDCAETVDIMLFADDSKAVRKASECRRILIDLDNIGA